MHRPPRPASALVALAAILSGSLHCSSNPPRTTRFAYDPEGFREALHARVPALRGELALAPFEIGPEIIALARKRVMAAPRGPARIRALVDFLSEPKPEGLGLEYDWAASATASRTLEAGRGNCVSLALVLVGLGRGLGWPFYFAEARAARPETHEFEEVTVLSDHMVVIVVTKTVRMVIDFLGLVEEEGYTIRPIDDLTAYAHLINNVAGHRVVGGEEGAGREDWVAAAEAFELATRIQPDLGRAWNNLGIAYTRLGRFDEARAAYHRALSLDTAFGSARHNLTIMETRAAGEPVLIEHELPE